MSPKLSAIVVPKPRSKDATAIKVGFRHIFIFLVFLVGFIALAFPTIKSLGTPSKSSKTRGLLARLSGAADSFYADFGYYPPDGFDKCQYPPNPDGMGGIVLGNKGYVYKNSGCLLYFLTSVHILNESSGQRVGPYLQLSFMRDCELPTHCRPALDELRRSGQEVSAELGQLEVFDAFGHPLEYDNTENLSASNRKGHENVYDQWPLLYGKQSSIKPHWATNLPKIGPRSKSGSFLDRYFCDQVPSSVRDRCLTQRLLIPGDWDSLYWGEFAWNSGLCIDPRRSLIWDDVPNTFKYLQTPKPINEGKFDLWSHDSDWFDPRDDRGNW